VTDPLATVGAVLARTGTPTSSPTPTPLDSTAVSSPELAAVVATTFAVLGALLVLLRLRGR
jgi:hypothetical protein